ncbi:MAG TPA: flagellar basal-body rod protein FlgF [Hyphomicrobiales bacterium]|nr:flagellar basal-body rod protein FlgF [Hyphomicrobiales bacterium]
MDNTLAIGLSRQMVLERQLDVVANNLANVDTAGYKSQGMRFERYLASGGRGIPASAEGRQPLSYVTDPGDFLDFSEGAIENTHDPLDVALDGEGFLVVQTPEGERYTRDGALKLDAAGRLVTASGDPVLGANGPVTFSQSETDIAIGADGTISSSQGLKDRLRLVRFADPQKLSREGGNLYAASDPPDPIEPGKLRVVSGALERSNVQPITATTRLIEISRAYQLVANAIQSTSSLRETAIQQLADVAA